MEFWPEFLASSWGREFVAGGFGGMAGVISGHPLDTLRIRMQQPPPSGAGSAGKVSATRLLRNIVAAEGPSALYRGMTAPLASVAFQNAVAFQVYALLSRALDTNSNGNGDPPSYKSVALAGFGTGALQSLILTPVELLKIRLQLQIQSRFQRHSSVAHHRQGGPMDLARLIFQREGVRGLYRGLSVTMLRDAPAHAVYFWTYEYTREQLHPGCRSGGQESLGTMLVSGGLAGVASWVCCYPLDVVKSRLQGQGEGQGHHHRGGENLAVAAPRYGGIVDCFRKSVAEEGYSVLWRGLGTAVARAFVVNGTIFSAYEVALRCMANGSSGLRLTMDEA